MVKPSASSRSPIRFGVFELDRGSGELHKDGFRLKLEKQPVQLLEFLIDRAGEVVTRKELREHLWPAGTFVDFDHGINTAIKKLRQVLDDSAETPRYIETLPRRGYRFIYPVATRDNQQPTLVNTNVSSIPPLRMNSWGGLVTVASAMVFAAVLVLAIWPSVNRRSMAGERNIKSVAVLPLTDLSGDAHEFFADGMTEELVTELSKATDVKVISRTSVMRYRNTQKSLSKIGKDLGVETILQGTVAHEGNRVRITLQLIDIENGNTLWAERYERDLTSILALQAEIARQVAGEFVNEKRRRPASEPASVNPEAYESYLKGRYLSAQWSNPENVNLAISFYDRAIEKDPSFAQPYAARAMAYLMSAAALVETVSPKEIIRQARASAERAIELDVNNGEAYEALGWIAQNHDWNWSAAETNFQHAMELNSNSATAYMWMAHHCNVMAKHDQALIYMQKSYSLDPLSPHVHWSLAEEYLLAGETEKAVQTSREGLLLHPDFWPFPVIAGEAYLFRGQYDLGLIELEKAVNMSHRHSYALGVLASAFALAGMRKQAESLYLELLDRAHRGYVSPAVMVRVTASLGHNDLSFSWIEKGIEQRLSEVPRIPLWGPMLGTLRQDPRYAALMRRLNLPS